MTGCNFDNHLVWALDACQASTPAPPSAATYALGDVGSADCPSGYKPILEDSQCSAAADEMGLTWNDKTYSNWCPTGRPKGCFQYTPNSQVYNNDICDGGV